MKILLMTRLFSGLAPELEAGRWQPTGAPAIVKLINRLDIGSDDLEILFYEPASHGNRYGVQNYKLEGLTRPVNFLQGFKLLRLIPTSFRDFAYTLFRAAWLVKKLRREEPDILYTDRSNILSAALAARLTKTKVVLRVLGMPPEMGEQILESGAVSLRVTRWAYTAPFTQVIGTADGSFIKTFFERALRPDVEHRILLNGTDPNELSQGRQDDRLRLLFLGRMELTKGPGLLVDAVAALPLSVRSKLSVEMIGYGPEQENIRQKITELGLEGCICMLGRMAAKEVHSRLPQYDAYVSLNRRGQLSNANLEAARAGLCLILADTLGGDDEFTRTIFPRDTAIWFDRMKAVPELTDILSRLITQPEELDMRKRKMREIASGLKSWDQRIDHEINMLSKISKGEF